MLKLSTAAHWWPGKEFATVLAREIEDLHQDASPLHKALTQGGRIDDNSMTASVLQTTEAGDNIKAKVGVIFVEIVGGCSCGDDEPAFSHQYCELSLLIDKRTGDTEVALIGDG